MASLLSQKTNRQSSAKTILAGAAERGWLGWHTVVDLKKEDRGAQRGLLRRRKAFNV